MRSNVKEQTKNNTLFIIILVAAAVFMSSWSKWAAPASPLPLLEFKYERTNNEVVFTSEPAAALFSWPIHEEDYIDLSSPFGERDPESIGGYGDDFHDGLDLYGTWRARINSISDGTVVCHFIPPNETYSGHPVFGGLLVVHTVIEGTDWWIRYGHLSDTSVHEGDEVLVGDQIGRQGSTGNCINAHLHIEIWKGGTCRTETGQILGGQRVNPLKYMERI